jgi:hypothetical protein
MSTSKLRIDLSQGVVEVEGSDTFVLTVYADFKDRLSAAGQKQIPPPPPPAPAPTGASRSSKGKKPVTSATGTTKSRKKGRDSQVIVKDLDLSKGKNGRLKTFYEKYDLKTNYERNLVFVYYMQFELELDGITDNHVFTCYRDVGAKLPKALRQSLIDAASQKGWLDTSDMDNIRVVTPGVNFLEHDLSKAGVGE